MPPELLADAPNVGYRTRLGQMRHGDSIALLSGRSLARYRGKVQLVFTSPPFPLNRKKKYGNLNGEAYVEWLSALAPLLRDFVTPNGSIVIELGNAWTPGQPTISTLPLEALLAFKRAANLHLCQEFICYNPAKLPTPAQWVTVERSRVKDSFTRVWWMSPTPRPSADNRRVLTTYSESMQKLLARGTYNSGRRPSEHVIGKESFLTNHGGAIASNVIIPNPESLTEVLPISNTGASDRYQSSCREKGIEPHPARMPAALVEFFIEFLTERKDIVLDPFGGSNTTGAVAEALGRRWIAIESNPDYIEGSMARFDSDSVRGRR